MNRRGFMPRMLALLAAPITMLTRKPQELMVVFQWDWHGRWIESRMKDLHIHELFTMVHPGGEPRWCDGKIFQALSEPYLCNDSLEGTLDDPQWGIDGKEVQGDPRMIDECDPRIAAA